MNDMAALPTTDEMPPEPAQPVLPSSPPPEKQATEPNEKNLWQLLKNRQYDAALAAIKRMQSAHAGWQPPQELLGLLQKGRLQQQIDRAIKKRDVNALAQLGEAHPEFFGCDSIEYAWALAGAHAALKHQDALRQGLYGLIPACSEQD
ncbi:MAG TPA: hypothetical protein VEP71_02200, partial [Gallionella sp.]|nr:hypothetical protein [Gallionella sp.]